MRPIRGPRFWIGLTVVLSVGVIAGLWALTVPFAGSGGGSTTATDSAEPTSSESPSGSSTPTGPTAPVLDSGVLGAIGEGWTLTSAVDSSGAVTVIAIDPSGGVYPGASLSAGAELLAWLADGRAIVHDPVSGELRAEVVSVDGGAPLSLGSGWVDPEVAIPADGAVESIMVASGPVTARTIDAVSTATGAATRLADAEARTGLVASADGSQALTAVGEAPADIVLSTSSGDSSAGTPFGASACEPAAWDAGRQAIIVCADDQTTVWALEPSTATYASAATLPAVEERAFAASGSRILVEGGVHGVDGTLRWELPEETAEATQAAFSGASLVLWSPGSDGLSSQVALVRADGRLAALVDVPDGYNGFAQVVGFGPFS